MNHRSNPSFLLIEVVSEVGHERNERFGGVGGVDKENLANGCGYPFKTFKSSNVEL